MAACTVTVARDTSVSVYVAYHAADLSRDSCRCRWASSDQPNAISMASCSARSEHCGLGMVQLHLLGPGKHKLFVSMHLEAH